MFVRIEYPKIQAFDSNGNLAANYEIHTYNAGLATAATTYSDRLLTVPNTNPVVLDSRGEADIYTGVALKLIFTIPGGDPASPIWTVDYIGEMQANFVTGDAISGSVNNYDVDPVPPITALTDRFLLIATPDVDNVSTLGAQVFTGIGIDDAVFTGPYVGTTVGSVFTVEIDSLLIQPPPAPIVTLSGVVGVVTAGDHTVKISAVTAEGETTPGLASTNVAADGTHKIDVSAIPTIGGAITGYNVYMNEASGAIWYLVNLAPITTNTYAINITDAVLATQAAAPTTNTTGGSGVADTFKWKKDGPGWNATGIVITGTSQTLIEGVNVTFASISGHTLGDIKTVTVTTSATVNLCSLGALLVYKNVAGVLQTLDAGDMKADIPATLVYSSDQNCWILNNPSTAAAPGVSLSNRIRKELVADYQVVLADAGNELSCSGTFTVTLPIPADFAGKFLYIKNKSTGTITIDGQGFEICGYGNLTGVTYFTLNRRVEAVQLSTNGLDWHILTIVVAPDSAWSGKDSWRIPGTYNWTCPVGVVSVDITVKGGGGGGAYGDESDPDISGNYGDNGTTDVQPGVVVVPGTVYIVTVGAGGAGADVPGDGSVGGTSSVDALAVGAGGAGGSGTCATPLCYLVPSGSNGGYGGSRTVSFPPRGGAGGPGMVDIDY